MSVLESWLSQFEGKTRTTYESAFKNFLEWAKATPEELVKIYKEAPDKNEWSKEWGLNLLRFQSEMLEKGVKKNGKPYKKGGVRNAVVAVQSFFSSTCQKLIVRRGRIIPVQMRTNEHMFSINDLRKMFDVANTRDKAILSTAVSLGWSISDFLSLKRQFIKDLIERAKSENLKFITFDWLRNKTDAPILGILTPESLYWLEQWIKTSEESEYLWASNRGEKLRDQTVSDILTRLAKDSGIVTTGTIHFHGFRKFLMTILTTSGLNEFEVKTILGKKIPISDATYLRIKDDAFSKFKQAYPFFSLIKTEANGKIAKVEEVLDTMMEVLRDLVKDKLQEKGLMKMTKQTDWKAIYEKLLPESEKEEEVELT